MSILKRLSGNRSAGNTTTAQKFDAQQPDVIPFDQGSNGTLDLSEEQLREMAAELGSLNEQDFKKVKAVKSAINTGTFNVNSILIADTLINQIKETINSRSRKPK